MRTITASSLLIGQLSGPIHLAHLARRPVLTWAQGRDRFRTVDIWNPFNMKCTIVSCDTFNPSVDSIILEFERLEIK